MLYAETHGTCEYFHRILKGKLAVWLKHFSRRTDIESYPFFTVSLRCRRPCQTDRRSDHGVKLVLGKFKGIRAKGVGGNDVTARIKISAVYISDIVGVGEASSLGKLARRKPRSL